MGNTINSLSITRNEDNSFNPVLTGSDSDSLVVLRDYPSADISEPIFRTGERLRVLAEEGPWWKVCSVQTKTENYIPKDHVAKIFHGWLFEGVDRQKAEELLTLPGNKVGSFLIRESAQERGVYTLSVRHRSVMHYRILRLPNNWYYISPRLTFQCLEELINHYYDSADGLCCILIAPCLALPTNPQNLTSQAPLVVMRRNRDRRNVDRTKDNSGDANNPLSFGVRNSIASYLSLTGSEKWWRGNSSHKKRSRSVYVMPSHELNSMPMEDD
ncbi:hypothetical protein AAFF_G00360680 [Aldrovandia affinis]|uniref:Src-like-adapter n=1 Tax=Aldrovandia affinis TaxID=143900 RepID=A0AAD7WN82_9TELE|nr:hypothetical protein AAFF_G00360680 [Aldrovandia affinis]